MGNITQVNDAAVKTIFYNNALVVAVSDYTYDSLYRLVTASGRELDDIANFGSSDNWDNSPFIGSYTSLGSVALHNYAQTYVYDTIGIITSLQHAAGAASYTRTNVYSIANNRLSTSQIGSGTPYSYNYHNEHGFLISMPHLTAMKWNFKEELAATSKQAGVNPETTYYQYDSSGKRLRKITENASAAQPPVVKEQRIYIAGYEYYEKFGTGSYVTKTLSLIDNGQRFLMVERSTKSGITSPLTRYIHPNHQGSSNLETDDSGNVITYEEYHPFGTTAYQLKNPSINAMAKRYRYTGMERDDETGLSYHNARYYIPWLGRWLSPDPIGIGDGVNVYAYCKNNPVTFMDTEGTQVGSGGQSYTIEVYKPSDLQDANARRTNIIEKAPVISSNPTNLLAVPTTGTSRSRNDSIIPGTGPTPLQRDMQELFRSRVTKYAIDQDIKSDGKLHENPDDKKITAEQLGYQWVMGSGRQSHIFNQNSTMGKQMLRTPEIMDAMRRAIVKKTTKNDQSLTEFRRSAGAENPILYAESFFTDKTENPARAFHGSFTGEIKIQNAVISQDGKSMEITMSVTAEDHMTAISATHAPFIGSYNESAIAYENNPYGPFGQFRTIDIYYNMKVTVTVPIKQQEEPLNAPPSNLLTPTFDQPR